ncbi:MULTISPECIES: DUF7144 family membrane protein [Actinoalloteichus]|uniref:DUF7144 domain-containing protein n=1 Tax=Actinoalloteichus caeruleus DSM 43889 TaxID=1120930 RepID=A0ABT1JH01_ACTCY|nr:hypothetical protein [Actinoalloteichus caeruleus]MCP2331780.1 hypothetical protein [Actinoalloteichus caeruleus DSM 43889]
MAEAHMSHQPAGRPAGGAVLHRDGREGTGQGWVLFAGIFMILLGAFHVIQGLVALLRSDYFLVTENGLLVQFNFTAWGWIHLVLGVVAVLAGLGIMTGAQWARITGIVLAGLSVLVNLAFLAAYPLWTTLIIAFDILVIYALAVHGREARTTA